MCTITVLPLHVEPSVYADYIDQAGNDEISLLVYSNTGKYQIHTNIASKQNLINLIKNYNEKKQFEYGIVFCRAVPEVESTQSSIGTQPIELDKGKYYFHHGTLYGYENYIQPKLDGYSDSYIPKYFAKDINKVILNKFKGSFVFFVYQRNTIDFYVNYLNLMYYPEYGILSTANFYNIENKVLIPANHYGTYFNGRLIKLKSWAKQNKNSVIVLASGGMDSLSTAYLYKYNNYDVKLLYVNYGQRNAKEELKTVEWFSKEYKTELIIHDTNELKNFKSALINLDRNFTAELDAESTMSYVPLRNLFLATLGGMYAEELNINRVALGLCLTDALNYPDNSMRFMYLLNNQYKASTKPDTRIDFRAPLINLLKSEFIPVMKEIGFNIEKTFSCYNPVNGEPCNSCGACLKRNLAFKNQRKINYKDIKHRILL